MKPPSPVMHHTSAWPGHLRADGGRQAKTHRAQSAGSQEMPRFKNAVELRRPHLVLAHVRSDVALPAGFLTDAVDDVLRVQAVCG